jgi:hypothetical protein
MHTLQAVKVGDAVGLVRHLELPGSASTPKPCAVTLPPAGR